MCFLENIIKLPHKQISKSLSHCGVNALRLYLLLMAQVTGKPFSLSCTGVHCPYHFGWGLFHFCHLMPRNSPIRSARDWLGQRWWTSWVIWITASSKRFAVTGPGAHTEGPGSFCQLSRGPLPFMSVRKAQVDQKWTAPEELNETPQSAEWPSAYD